MNGCAQNNDINNIDNIIKIDYIEKYNKEEKERIKNRNNQELLPLSIQKMFYQSMLDIQKT